MRNKFIIATLALALSTGVIAQTEEVVASSEKSITAAQIDVTNKIELYPNPAVDYLVVRISNSTLTNTQFELRSIIGNEIAIKPEEMGNGRYRIPVKDFASGYYFVVVKDENARFKEAFKFLKR